jgi:3-mercaptopyruvate sulfurtransferase SseA
MAKVNTTARHAAVYPSHLESTPVGATKNRPSNARYRVYLTARGVEAGSAEEIVAAGDQEAMAAARALVEARPVGHCDGFTLIGPMARVIATWQR